MRVGDTLRTVLFLIATMPLVAGLIVREDAKVVLLGGLQTFELPTHRTVQLLPEGYNATLLVEVNTPFGNSTASELRGIVLNHSFPDHANVSSFSFLLESEGGSFKSKSLALECDSNCSLDIPYDGPVSEAVLNFTPSARSVNMSMGNWTYSRDWHVTADRRVDVLIEGGGGRVSTPIQTNKTVRCFADTQVPCWSNWTGRHSCQHSELLTYYGDGNADVNVVRVWSGHEPYFHATGVSVTVCSYNDIIQPHDFKCTLAGIGKTARVDTSSRYACGTMFWNEQEVTDYVDNNHGGVLLTSCGSRGDVGEFLPLWQHSDCAPFLDAGGFYDIRMSIDYDSTPEGVQVFSESGGNYSVYLGADGGDSWNAGEFDISDANVTVLSDTGFFEDLTFNLSESFVNQSSYSAQNHSASLTVLVDGGVVRSDVRLVQKTAENVSVCSDDLLLFNETRLFGSVFLNGSSSKGIEITQTGDAELVLKNLTFQYKEVPLGAFLGGVSLPELSTPFNITLENRSVSHNHTSPLKITSHITANRSFHVTPNESIQGNRLIKSLALWSPINATSKTLFFTIESNSVDINSQSGFVFDDGNLVVSLNSSEFLMNWTVVLPPEPEVEKEEASSEKRVSFSPPIIPEPVADSAPVETAAVNFPPETKKILLERFNEMRPHASAVQVERKENISIRTSGIETSPEYENITARSAASARTDSKTFVALASLLVICYLRFCSG